MGTERVLHDERVFKVSALRNGTVIDHLAVGTALRVLAVLGLDGQAGAPVAIGLSLDSAKLGKKDLIKIENRELTQDEVNKIALISPAATLAIIREFQVVRKSAPELQDRLEGVVRCMNPSCISNQERMKGRFRVLRRQPLRLRCDYCERTVAEPDVELV